MTDKAGFMPTINASKLQQVFFHLLVPALFFGFVFSIMPIADTFEFDVDEGINLIKTLLYSEGFSLYKDISNDQPPLFTAFLSSWFRLFGQTVFAARILILLFSTLLIWSFYQTLRTYLGNILPLVSTLLLVTSSEFIQLSVSVMIGMPSLSMTMLSIYTLTLYKRKRNLYLLLASGCLLALSFQIKLFTVFLMPIMILYLLDFRIRRDFEEVKHQFFPIIILWLGAVVLVYLFIGISFHSISYEQLLQPHVTENVKESLKSYGGLGTIGGRMIRRDYILSILGLLGILVVLAKKQRDGLFPLAWLVAAGILLFNHRPIWYHHYHLLSIPLSWLAAYGATAIFNFFYPKSGLSNFKSFTAKKLILRGLVGGILLLLTFVCFYTKYTQLEDYIASKRQEYDRQLGVIHLLSEHRGANRWVFTDHAIYAFYAGLRVPPEIAVFSIKQFVTGNLSDAELLLVLQKYLPEQILLSRFRDGIRENKEIMAYINQNYSIIYEDELKSYYRLK